MTSDTYSPPGPGSWALDASHCERPMSRFTATSFPGLYTRGMRAGMERYGILLDTIELALVDGFSYTAVRPLGAPPGAKGAPPKLLLKLLLRVHPGLRRRVRRAGEVVAEKPWREDTRVFFDEYAPQLRAKLRDLQAVDVTTLEAAGLVAHVDEDGAQASFAGQHLTVLGVRRATDLLDAVRDVHASAHEPSVLAYRARLGIAGPPRIAVVLQRMLEPRCAGVLFTRHPVTGNDERLVEASWGVGEAVVSGLVEPDRVRMRRGGEVIEQHVGVKDVAIRAAEHGMTETAVDEADRSRPCLDAEDLAALEGLAALCESAVPGAHDIEWAFVGRRLFLLQRRDVTR